MIAVEQTQKNWEIFDVLCELDAEYNATDDEDRRADIIRKAVEICEELEVN